MEDNGVSKKKEEIESKVQAEENEWRGWKNEIKQVIKESGKKVLLEELEGQVLKRYKQFGPDEDYEDKDLKQVFLDKLSKIKKVKQQTYVLLE